MNIYKNYIYMTICEISYECCLVTYKIDYQYQKYCHDFKLALDNGFLTNAQCRDIIRISSLIEKIYGLGEKDVAILISDYFNKKNLIEYEKVLRELNGIFPDYFKYNIPFKK